MKQQNLGKQGSCMTRSSLDLDNKLVIYQIMQKFRPIAPKPLSSNENALSNGVTMSSKKSGRVKRKYSRRKIKKKEEKSGSILDDEVVTTLQLLPSKLSESSEILKSVSSSKSSEEVVQVDRVDELTTLLKYPLDNHSSSSSTEGKEKVRVVETCIIVECITGVCMGFHNNKLLGLSDNEKINNLHIDLSPCFVSDYLDKVVYINEAYKKMVLLNHHEDIKNNSLDNNYNYNYFPREVKVELVMKEKIPNWFPKAFSCTARVIQSKWWRGQHEKYSRTIPCDVWRMEIGGFAWKLDIETALGLGL